MYLSIEVTLDDVILDYDVDGIKNERFSFKISIDLDIRSLR